MKPRTRIICLIACVPLLLGGSCPTPDGPLPPVLNAPSFLEGSVVLKKINNEFAELVYLQWEPPDTDSVSVSEYVIIQHLPFDTAVDTLGIFSGEPERLPPTRTFAYQYTEDVRRYASGEILLLYYQIFAIDNFGRPGDTSAQFGVYLLKNAVLKKPIDTLKENLFIWEVPPITDEIYTNMSIWNVFDTLPVYTSDTIDYFGSPFDPVTMTKSIPSFPLQAGEYSWTVWMRKLLVLPESAPYAISYTTGKFSVP